MDTSIRGAVRQWIKLPHDTPKAFFHAKTKDGGLDIHSLEFMIPTLKQRRLLNLCATDDPVVRAICKSVQFKKELAKWTKPRFIDGLSCATTRFTAQAWAAKLHNSVDGQGLKEASKVGFVHDWVTNGSSLLSGAKFNAAISLRAGTLPTGMRSARGRDLTAWCDCCGAGTYETLSHQLQVCPRTHGARTKRHDRISQEATKALSKAGWKTIVEPHIKTRSGLRIPDLIIYAEEKPSYVIDTTIVADNTPDIDQPHRDKKAKYGDNEDLCRTVQQLTGSPPLFSSITLNWRGCFSPESAADLMDIGLTKATLTLLAAITAEQGAVIHRLWNTSTRRTKNWRRPGG